MDTDTRTQIILAALAATPAVTEPTTNSKGTVIASADETHRYNVTRKAMDITLMTSPTSSLSRSIDLVDGAFDAARDTSKAFSAVITGVTIEGTSRRAIVALKTRVSEKNPEGAETARTDRTDTAAGALMAREANALVGHRVMVYLEMEVTRNDRNVRIVRHLVDLGVNQD